MDATRWPTAWRDTLGTWLEPLAHELGGGLVLHGLDGRPWLELGRLQGPARLHEVRGHEQPLATLSVPAELSPVVGQALADAVGQELAGRQSVRELASALAMAWKEANFLFDLGELLRDVLAVDEAAAVIMCQLSRVLRSEGAILYMMQDGALVPVAATQAAPTSETRSTALMAMTSHEAQVAEAMGGTSVCLPLADGEHAVGALCLYGSESLAQSTTMKFLGSVGSQIAQALRLRALLRREVETAELRRELELAAELQQRLLPHELPRVPGLGLAARCLPARTVGGDGYDLLQHDGGLDVLIADVSGHGVSAGMLMGSFMGTVRAQDRAALSPSHVAARANAQVCRVVGDGGYYVTGLYGRLSPDRRQLTYCSFGHLPMLRWRAGEVEVLPRPDGLPAGLLDEGDYGEHTVELRPGDILVLYTDGLTEALLPGGGVLGIEGLAEALRRVAPGPPEAILAGLFAACPGELQDDRTAVVVVCEEGER